MNMTVNNQQAANFQGLLLHGKIDTKQIGSHNGQKVETGPPQAKGPGFFGKVWIAIKSFFGGGGARTVAAAPPPPPRSSAPETASDVRAAAPAAPRLMKPLSREQIGEQVMNAIGISGRAEFNSAAVLTLSREDYCTAEGRKDVADRNHGVMNHVIDRFATLQKQSTHKEWFTLFANGNAGLVAKAIDFAKEFRSQKA